MGTVVVEGQSYSITGLAFHDGKLVITAFKTLRCDQAEITDAVATVFGTDQVGVCQSWKVSIPELKAGDYVTIILPIRIVTLTVPELPCLNFCV